MAFSALLVSCIFMAVSCFIAEIARKFINSFVKTELSRLLFHEFVAAAELCAVCFELVIVAEVYGISTYAILLFVLTIWWAARWHEAAGCPYIHLEAYLEGSSTFTESFLCCLAELAGGLAIYKYVQFLWDLKLADVHEERSVWECEADLQVSALYGAFVEGIATCLCRLASRLIAATEPRFATAIDSFIGTSLVVAACNYSGGYFNPVLATSLKFNCPGNTASEHFIVYWVGAAAGSVLSWWIHQKNYLDNIIGLTKPAEDKKIKQN